MPTRTGANADPGVARSVLLNFMMERSIRGARMLGPMETMHLPYEMNVRSLPLASLREWLSHVRDYFISVENQLVDLRIFFDFVGNKRFISGASKTHIHSNDFWCNIRMVFHDIRFDGIILVGFCFE